MCLQKLDQEWLEVRDRVINGSFHVAERFEQRISLDNLRFPERYVKGELNLRVRLKVALGNQNWLVLFQGANDRAQQRIEPRRFRPGWYDRTSLADNLADFSPADLNAPVLEGVADRDQQPVLIDNIELVQTPEGVPYPLPPS